MDIKWIAPTLDPNRPCTSDQAGSEVTEGLAGIRAAVATVEELGPWAAKVLHDYAVEGAWPGEETEIWQDMAAFCKLARAAAEMYGTAVPAGCERFMAMSILRARLDAATGTPVPPAIELEAASEHFTLEEVAVLTQMNERSVRNATLSTVPDRLKTVRVGTRTMVKAVDAKAWLLGRRSFKETSGFKKRAKR